MPDATYIACPRCGEPCAMTPMQKRLYHGRTVTCQRCAKPFLISEESPDPVPAPAMPVRAARQELRPDDQPERPVSPAPTAAGGSNAPAALRQAGQGISAGRMAVLIAVVSAVLSVLLYLAISPSLHRSREAARRASCASNLTQIGFALQVYANANGGRYPDSLDVLVADGSVPVEFLVCPSSPDKPAAGKTPAEQAANVSKGSHQTYVYLGKGLAISPAKKLLAYEPLSHHGGAGLHALYSDGSVQFLNKAAAVGALPQPAAGPATQAAASQAVVAP